ncbi:tail fiber domain-containing protein [Stenotrophomonas muris]|uniref:tail fiber domain-containing protein n=1 Tax=Stenotrophomonas muris TaxID=2963283 RepID=UPI00300F69E0
MPIPQITITPAGFAAIVNAENTGTAPVKVTQVGLTALHFDVGTVGASVPAEFKRLTTFGGKAVADDTLHLNVRDDGSDTYTLRGFGLYLQDGTLFAVYSQSTPIMEKAAAATLLLATDIRFAKINATSIEVGDIDFINPPATTTQMGVVRLATEQEADAGSDPATAITPRGLARYINNRFGAGAPSTFVKTLLGLATAAMFRVELGLKSAALRDEGHGNGLNADLLDGAHGDYYLDWKNFTGVPNRFTPAPHTHPIGEVDGLQPALDGKANRAGDTFTGPLAVNGAMLRSYGWGGVASNGILVLGDTGSSIVKNGAYFDFNNSAGGYTATLSAGGTIWTSGNFDPASRVKKSGDVMTGSLTMTELWLKNGGNANGWIGTTTGAIYFDARLNGSSTPNASMLLRANDFTWANANGSPVASLSNAGLYVGTSLRVQPGSGDQLFVRNEGSAGVTLDAVTRGNDAYAALSIRGIRLSLNGPTWVNGGDLTVSSGQLFVRGTSAAIWFADRDSGTEWAWYSQGGVARLNRAGDGDKLWISASGALSAVGGYDFGSSRRLKEIDGPVSYGLAAVERMELAAGRYKLEYNGDGRRRLFFVAEQLAELVPEAVDLEGVEFNGERVPSIKLDQLLPVLARAIQELAGQVRELRERV